MIRRSISVTVQLTLLVASLTLHADTDLKEETVMEACVSLASRTATGEQTIAQLREQCKEKLEETGGLLSERKFLEKEASNNRFAILPHKPNYILPFTYSEANNAPYEELLQGEEMKDIEAVFQVSLKFLAFEDVFIDDLDIYAGFTLKSWWQVYNDDLSAPFRETNYEPELIFAYTRPWSLAGLTIHSSSISLNHQSNGRITKLSRSWNRVIGDIGFETGDLAWNVRAWWRIPEDEKEYPDSPAGDDNPDIEKYLGYGALTMIWKLPAENNLDVMLRNNLRSENKGAVQVGWSFPLSTHLRGYVEYFNGYGESLIYYNHDTERIGLGVKLTDWL